MLIILYSIFRLQGLYLLVIFRNLMIQLLLVGWHGNCVCVCVCVICYIVINETML